jgi:cyclopropane-fatty-acyl-phospholipid synthase
LQCHTITAQYETAYADPWLDKHIFPGGWLPSVPRVIQEAEAQNFNCENVHGFGLYYSRTLNAWAQNFRKSWPELQKYDPMVFNEKFYRKWEYYLNLSEASFLTRQVNLHQFVLTKKFDRVYAYSAPF